MAIPLLYRWGRAVARITARSYFRRVEIAREDRMPREGAVILAANHPQSITDALILGLSTPRVIHFVAHSGLFRNPVQALLLRGAGVIPIHRRDDVDDAATRNASSFDACVEVLSRGECIGIFPEGTSQQDRRVQSLKTGTARIALEAEAAHGFGLGVRIVPVGLSFQSRSRFRSRVLVFFGTLIELATYKDSYAADPRAAAREITNALEHAIRHQVVDVSSRQLESFVGRVERVYKHELAERPELTVPGLSRFERDQFLARQIARATDYFYEHRPELIWGMAEMLEEYERKLQRLGIADRMVRDEESGFAGTATRLAIAGIVGFPVAAWGLATNYIPYRITEWVTAALGPDRTKTHTTQLAVGAMSFGSFYLAYLLWAVRRFDGWTVLILGLSVPLAGLFARRYLATMQRRRRHLRFAYLRGTQGLMIQKLRTFRRQIVAAMDEALEIYMGRDEKGDDT